MDIKYDNIIKNKQQTIFCLELVAISGFLDKNDINLRLICSNLKNIHISIFHHLNLKT